MTITKDPSTTTSHQHRAPSTRSRTAKAEATSNPPTGLASRCPASRGPTVRTARTTRPTVAQIGRFACDAEGVLMPRSGHVQPLPPRLGPRRQSRVPARWDHAGEDPVAAVAGAADRLPARCRIGRLAAGLVPRIRGHRSPSGLPSRRARDRRRMGGSCATRCSASTAAPASESASRWNATGTPASHAAPYFTVIARGMRAGRDRAGGSCGRDATSPPSCGR